MWPLLIIPDAINQHWNGGLGFFTRQLYTVPNIDTHRAKYEFLAFVTNSLTEIVLRKMLESGPLGNAGNLDVEMYLRVSQYGKALVN